MVERAASGRAEHRAAPREHAPQGPNRQLGVALVEDAPPGVVEPEQVVAVVVLPLADDGTDDRVEARTVTATGQHAYPHGGTVMEGNKPVVRGGTTVVWLGMLDDRCRGGACSPCSPSTRSSPSPQWRCSPGTRSHSPPWAASPWAWPSTSCWRGAGEVRLEPARPAA